MFLFCRCSLLFCRLRGRGRSCKLICCPFTPITFCNFFFLAVKRKLCFDSRNPKTCWIKNSDVFPSIIFQVDIKWTLSFCAIRHKKKSKHKLGFSPTYEILSVKIFSMFQFHEKILAALRRINFPTVSQMRSSSFCWEFLFFN